MTRTTATRLWPLILCTSVACAAGDPEGALDEPPAAVEATAGPDAKPMLCAEDAPTIPRVALSWDDGGALVVTSLLGEPIVAHVELAAFDGASDRRVALDAIHLDAGATVRVEVASKVAAPPSARMQLRARADVFADPGAGAGAPERLARTFSERVELQGGRIAVLDAAAEVPVFDPGGRLDDDDRVALRRTLRSPGVASEAILIAPEVTREQVRATRHVALEGGAQ